MVVTGVPATIAEDLENENYNLLFVRDREKTKEYLRQLSEAKLTKQTQVNYLKSLKRLVEEWKNRTDVEGGYVSIALKNTKRFKKTPEGDKVEENPQERYSVPQVTSQVARRVFETMEKSLVADYLTHSTATAEKHYRMKKGASLLKGYKIILALGAEASGESSEETAKTMQPHNPQLDFQAIWDNFQQDHPVTVDGTVPGLATRNEASKEHQRKLYERWMKSQLKLRGWKTNIPSVSSVLNERKPTGSLEDIPFSTGIRRLVSNQKWKGLKLVNIEGKGKGILAGRKSVITMVPSSQVLKE
ncbi:hypothetical protein INR49_007532 [Caranx melampygus]|nr:hypothetical protein INR49_007532 [Caranx melampygus]